MVYDDEIYYGSTTYKLFFYNDLVCKSKKLNQICEHYLWKPFGDDEFTFYNNLLFFIKKYDNIIIGKPTCCSSMIYINPTTNLTYITEKSLLNLISYVNELINEKRICPYSENHYSTRKNCC